MLMPKRSYLRSYLRIPLQRWCCGSQKRYPCPKAPKLIVVKTMQSLHSRGLVKQHFAWRHFCWYLTNEGIEFLGSYLHLSPEIFPATLKRPARLETARSGDVSKTGEDRSAYRRAPGGADKKGDVGTGAGDVEFRGGFGRGRPQ